MSRCAERPQRQKLRGRRSAPGLTDRGFTWCLAQTCKVLGRGGPKSAQQDTDDEQDTKTIEVVPFPRSEQPKDKTEVQALIIEDLKTSIEVDGQPGVFARRQVQRGSVVVVRGTDEDSGEEATWVALVKKVYRGKGGTPHVVVTWFNRESDIPAKEARRAKLARNAPRQLLFSNAEDTIEAKYIRHPATAWFLPAGAALPRMRCGDGHTRHVRMRPGFLVQHAYDSEGQKVYNIGSAELRRECPALAKEVERLVQQSQAELARLQKEEEQHDEQQGMQGQPKPLALLVEAEAEREPSPVDSESETSSSSSSDSESDDVTRMANQAAALASKAAAAAESMRRRQEEVAQRAAAAAAQKQRQVQQAVDAAALRLAGLLPQQEQQPEQQQEGQQQLPLEQQGQQQAVAGPAAAAAAATEDGVQAVKTPGGVPGQCRRCAQQLQKHAGRLPFRSAPAAGKPGAGGPVPAAAAVREAAEVQKLLQGCCTPSPKPLAALLRAVCGCTQAASHGMFTEHVQMFFGRVLLTWLWHLVSLQLPDLQEAAKTDPAAEDAAAEVAGCIELLLKALEQQRYTPAYDKWLALVQGHKLISALARNAQGSYPPAVQQAASQLKELWTTRAYKMREHLAQRQRQKQQEQKREAAKERADAELLQRSPLASMAATLATCRLRTTALGAGGATYVRPRHSPSPAAAAKLQPPPVHASLARAPGAAQRPAEQRRLSLSGAMGPAAASTRDQQQAASNPVQQQQQQQQQPSKPVQPKQQQSQQQKQVGRPAQLQQQQQQAGKLAQPQQQQQPGRRTQPQPQQQQQAGKQAHPSRQQPGKPGLPQVQTKAAAADADPLSAAWMNAFKGSPRGNQPLPRSATMPAQQAAAMAKQGAASAAGPRADAPAAQVPRSFSVPESDARQQAAAAAPRGAAASSQTQAVQSGQEQGASSSGAPATGRLLTKAPMDVADAALAELAEMRAKLRGQKRPAAEVIDVQDADEQRAAKVTRRTAKPHAPPSQAGGSKGHKLAALVKKAQRQGSRL